MRRLASLVILILLSHIVLGCQTSEETLQGPQELASEGQTHLPVSPGISSSAPYMPIFTPLEDPLGSSNGVPKELEAVWEAWALLNREHVDKDSFDSKEFEEFAIKGLVGAVGDTHTSYIEPVVLKIETEDLSGEFEGIGAHVRRREDGAIQIVSPIEGGPAEAAGVQSGDIILAVNGKVLEGLSILEAVSLIRGPRGSTVILTIKHVGLLEPVDISIVRDVIALPSVLLRSSTGSAIAHVRITEFKANTAEIFREVLRKELDNGAEALILDLRGNPGGYLQQVFEIADMFMNKDVILIEQRQDGEYVWESEDGGMAVELPVVLLINGASASGSEIIMGAFQDTGRAQVVGETSFGKGTVNVFRKLTNGGGLYMSIGRWFTPNRRPIEGEGLSPDFNISFKDSQKTDIEQVQKAIKLLEEFIDGQDGSN